MCVFICNCYLEIWRHANDIIHLLEFKTIEFLWELHLIQLCIYAGCSTGDNRLLPATSTGMSPSDISVNGGLLVSCQIHYNIRGRLLGLCVGHNQPMPQLLYYWHNMILKYIVYACGL